MRAKDLAAFIISREAHRKALERGQIDGCFDGWDPIIAKYRFCNVIRADDRVTKYIFDWAGQYQGNHDLWFAFVVARLFNNPGTLEAIGRTVLPFKPAGMSGILAKRKAAGEKLFNAAYIVSTNGRAMDKVEYVLIHVLQPLWADRAIYRPKNKETLESWHERLQGAQGMGSFMAAQVCADLKEFHSFPDYDTFAASGPGSRLGLNYVMGKVPKAPWKENTWRATLAELRAKVLPMLPPSIRRRLTAQDLQNCLCEAGKWFKVRYGHGKPKQLYVSSAERKSKTRRVRDSMSTH